MIKQIVFDLGGVAATSRLLGVSQPAVSQWLREGRVPAARAVQIEALTGGRFKAAVMLKYTGIKTEPKTKTKTKIKTETEGVTDDGL